MKKSDIIFILILILIGAGAYFYVTSNPSSNGIANNEPVKVKTQIAIPTETPDPIDDNTVKVTPEPIEETPDSNNTEENPSQENSTPTNDNDAKSYDKRLFNPEGAIMFKNIALYLEEGKIEMDFEVNTLHSNHHRYYT